MFQNKDIDPRECTYRLLPTSKLRAQIDQLLIARKIQISVFKPKSMISDSQISKRNNNLIKRNKNRNNKKDDDEGNTFIDPDKMEKVQIIKKLSQIETLLDRYDEDQKQTFTYNDLIELHRLLQHLDSDQMKIAKEYFYQFLEENFRVIHPEKRQNTALDERLQKLKFKAAAKDYNSMVSNMSHYVIGNRFSMQQEFKNIRSILLATINALMVIGATFFFFYFAITYARPELDIAKVVLYSFIASIIVAIAEIYFLIRII